MGFICYFCPSLGVSDTGIDMMNKYFYDPDHAVPYNTVNSDCRKVIAYMYAQGKGDRFDNEESYHGTHVAGSVGGKHSAIEFSNISSVDCFSCWW